MTNLNGSGRDERIDGGVGDDSITGGAGNDVIFGDNLIANGTFEGDNLSSGWMSSPPTGWTEIAGSYNTGPQVDSFSDGASSFLDTANTVGNYSGFGQDTGVDYNASESYNLTIDVGTQFGTGTAPVTARIYLLKDDGTKVFLSSQTYTLPNGVQNTFVTDAINLTVPSGASTESGTLFVDVYAQAVSGNVGQALIDNIELTTTDPAAYGGNDTIDGGAGDDFIDGGIGNDSLIGGTGADTITGGVGHDTIDGGADNDTIVGGAGADSIAGGSGDDVIDSSGSSNMALKLDWTDQGANNTDLRGGFTQDTGGVNATVSYTNDGNGTHFRVDNDEPMWVGSGEPFDPMSSGNLGGGGVTGNTATVTVDFSAVNRSGFANEVENVTFRINDFDMSGFVDILTVRAYDANGDPIELTLNYQGVTTTGINPSLVASGTTSPGSEVGSVLVSIPGPVSYFEIDYDQGGSDATQSLWITDVHFDAMALDGSDTVDGGIGNDSIFTGDGADFISGGEGDDTINGGAGNDTIGAYILN